MAHSTTPAPERSAPEPVQSTAPGTAPHKVLVANRGEIACRIIRGAREMGLPTVAVFSDADADAVHTWMADEAVRLGPAPSAESYLLGDRILQAARDTGATIIHPGYGFLSENPDFREACEAAGLRFAGPSADAMRKMGVKTLARDTMRAAGVPVVPGSDGPVTSGEEATRIALEMGLPVMVKAASGGGGKGMRLVHEADEVARAFDGARREAKAYFGDDTVYLEKAIICPRHVEVQVLADRHGHTVHVFDRECSVQRRNQKIIEESPAPHLSDETRARMGAVAVRAAQAVDYQGAGTIEFLVDQDENFYFLEMNTRLQVEHPVTEMVTGVDLVVEMLRVAMGQPLSIRQEDIVQRGHAIECRVYAEDPARGFLPSPGRLHVYRPPHGPGIRVDDGVEEGGEITSFYDPMIAKLSTWGRDRDQARARMNAALAAWEMGGISHNIPYLRWVLSSALFASGRYDTGIVEALGAWQADSEADEVRDALAALIEHRHTLTAPPNGEADKAGEATWTRAARTAVLGAWGD